MDVTQKVALDAPGFYIRNHTAIVYGQAREGPVVGSATCIEIDNRFFIATVAHNFDDLNHWILFSANSSSKTPLTVIGINLNSNRSSDEPDVAWLEIDPVSAEKSKLKGLPLELIDPKRVLDSSASYIISGLPAGFVKPKKINGEIQLIGDLFLTPLSDSDLSEGELEFEYDSLALTLDGSQVQRPHPKGMSGGGIWAAYLRPSPILSPSLNLIGMGRACNKIGDRVTKVIGLRLYPWLELLYDDLSDLRPSIEPLLKECGTKKAI